MPKFKLKPPKVTAPAPPGKPEAGFSTTDLAVTSYLNQHSISPVRCAGNPMVYEYEASQTATIQRLLTARGGGS